MRRVAVLVCLLVLALVAGRVTGLAAGVFSGSFTTQIGLDVPVGALEAESRETFADLAISCKMGPFTFSSATGYDMFGLLDQGFGARGSLGQLSLDSRLLLSPVFGGTGSTIDLTNSVNSPTHTYNLGRLYFVDQVEVTGLTLDDNANTKWRLRVSANGTDWEWISAEIAGNGTIPVVIPVRSLAKYIEIVASSGYVDESAISVQVSATAFVTSVGVSMAGISLDTELALATGGSSLTFTVRPTEEGSPLDRATIAFGMDPVTCVFGFESCDVGLELPFGCVEELSVDIGFECGEGFTDLALYAGDIKTGLSLFEVDLSITYSLSEKQVWLSPSLELNMLETCLTPLIGLKTGAEPTHIDGLNIYGVRIRSSVNGITFESLTYLDDIHHTKEDYWEMFSFAVDGDTCCGGGFDFEVTTHFGKTHDALFDWAETEIEGEFGLGEGFLFNTYLSFTAGGIDDLILGFVFTW
jgi:hypothetical protein